MVKLYDGGVYLIDGKEIIPEAEAAGVEALTGEAAVKEEAIKGTIAYSIMEAHNTSGGMDNLKLKFDAMVSHDITYVGIIQTAKASGIERFPIPYVLTNCHNSLCAVGGTINEDDHMFGLSAAKKYGGIYVPPHIAVIHQYMREMHAGCGRMILGSDSHTRYGALGTMAIGEGGGELVKQLLEDTYDVAYPGVVAVYLDGKPNPGVGPQDIALAIIGAVFKKGYVKNKVMEFVGPGIATMPTDFRNGIDVMTTETTCLSSVWKTDEDTKAFLALHGREEDYQELNPSKTAHYDGCVYVDLSTIKPMIALPFHPSNTYEIDALNDNLGDILREVEKEAGKISGGRAGFTLTDKIVGGKLLVDLMEAGAVIRTAFCGPCFGAGDTPCHNGLSVRHTTRNFPNREGSKPGNGQMSAVALMDARSIAATAANGGVLTSATQYSCWGDVPEYRFDKAAYERRVYQGFGQGEGSKGLVYGPNIKDWPNMSPLADHLLLKVCSKIMDEVTTTDELIPSGETSSFRSNPLGLAEFTLSGRDPDYVKRSKEVHRLETARVKGKDMAALEPELETVFAAIQKIPGQEKVRVQEIEAGSMIYAYKPGDGSSREQAASCQRVIGGLANITREYATKRYRSNVINWGMIPFQTKDTLDFEVGDYIYVPGVREALNGDLKDIRAYVVKGGDVKEMTLYVADMTEEEREIVKAGCLINYNKNRRGL